MSVIAQKKLYSFKKKVRRMDQICATFVRTFANKIQL